ncbi:MAG: CopK family periplasmic copper-binding protein [Candidatus Dadabacteria bacterium]|nr:CopK family periplasmic copper-binding protein [Candidatus Dadabacteria bacterium]
MRKLMLLPILFLSASAIAAGSATGLPVSEPLQLKDGSYLFIDNNDNMRMVDRYGEPIRMKDDVEMELKDGTLIMMKNKKVWRHIHRDTK